MLTIDECVNRLSELVGRECSYCIAIDPEDPMERTWISYMCGARYVAMPYVIGDFDMTLGEYETRVLITVAHVLKKTEGDK